MMQPEFETFQTPAPQVQVGDSILDTGSSPEITALFADLNDTIAVLGASTIGANHVKRGGNREDALAVKAKDNYVILAVADGVGSCKNSRFGSTFAVNAVSTYLLRLLASADDNAIENPGEIKEASGAAQTLPVPEDVQVGATTNPLNASSIQSGTLCWHQSMATQTTPMNRVSLNVSLLLEAFSQTHQGLLDFSARLGCLPEELGCTLLTVVWDRVSGEMVVGQLGDGMILARNQNGTVETLVPQGVPEDLFAMSAIYPLNFAGYEEHLELRHLSKNEVIGIDAIFLMSDGLADDLGSDSEGWARWSSAMVRHAREEIPLSARAVRLARWLATYSGSYDDRTVAILLGATPSANDSVENIDSEPTLTAPEQG